MVKRKSHDVKPSFNLFSILPFVPSSCFGVIGIKFMNTVSVEWIKAQFPSLVQYHKIKEKLAKLQ